MQTKYRVVLSKAAKKDLRKIPLHIAVKLNGWMMFAEQFGLRKTRKCPSYHDEPLRGRRFGQRSVRLNKSWRAIYVTDKVKNIVLIEVIEVTHHEY